LGAVDEQPADLGIKPTRFSECKDHGSAIAHERCGLPSARRISRRTGLPSMGPRRASDSRNTRCPGMQCADTEVPGHRPGQTARQGALRLLWQKATSKSHLGYKFTEPLCPALRIASSRVAA